MDEHFLTKRKYNRGRFLVTEYVQVWGAFDQTTKQVVIKRVPNSTNMTLWSCIAAFVREQSTIFADGRLRHSENTIVGTLGMHMLYWINHSEGTFAETITDPILGNSNINLNLFQ